MKKAKKKSNNWFGALNKKSITFGITVYKKVYFRLNAFDDEVGSPTLTWFSNEMCSKQIGTVCINSVRAVSCRFFVCYNSLLTIRVTFVASCRQVEEIYVRSRWAET